MALPLANSQHAAGELEPRIKAAYNTSLQSDTQESGLGRTPYARIGNYAGRWQLGMRNEPEVPCSRAAEAAHFMLSAVCGVARLGVGGGL